MLVLSQYSRPAYALRLLERQPERRAATCSRTGSPTLDELVDAIERVVAGESVVDPTISSSRSSSKPATHDLTRRAHRHGSATCSH